MAENPTAAIEHAGAELLVEVPEVARELVEDQRQREGHVLVLEAGVAIEDGLMAEVGRCLFDDGAVVTAAPSATSPRRRGRRRPDA